MYPSASVDLPILRETAPHTLFFGSGFSPLLIGGVGGSGTRLVVQMLQQAGMDMGSLLNDSADALPFVSLYDKHVDAYLSGGLDHHEFVNDFAAALHLDATRVERTGPWGWKNPRSVLLLPLLDSVISGLRYVLVVRDGRAMATSRNSNQLEKHSTVLLTDAQRQMSLPFQQIALWQKVNVAAAAYGEARMAGRFWIVRYEDVCASPLSALRPVFDAVGMDPQGLPASCVQSRVNEDLAPALAEGLWQMAGHAMRRFGYADNVHQPAVMLAGEQV